jgi:hypothetical protein
MRTMQTPRSLLERYVRAKDSVEPQLMREIYAPDAELTYSIATDSISFPARTVGLEAITRTLVVDFATRFAQCKTYYVCDAPPADDTAFARVPWLVIMREPAADSLRIGKGYYEWSFAHSALVPLQVTAMRIHIERMDAIADPGAMLLAAAQADLPYPWLAPVTLGTVYRQRAGAQHALAFLHDFAAPLMLPPM